MQSSNWNIPARARPHSLYQDRLVPAWLEEEAHCVNTYCSWELLKSISTACEWEIPFWKGQGAREAAERIVSYL